MNGRTISSSLAMLMATMIASSAFAQPQQEVDEGCQLQLRVQNLQQNQIQPQFVNAHIVMVNRVEPSENDARGGLTADEIAAVSETLNQFVTALEQKTGDNELAATFNYEEGSITRYKPNAAPEILKFDPAGGQSLREWLTTQMPPNVLRDWMKNGLYPTKQDNGHIHVRMTPSNLIGPVHTFEFEKQGQTLRIRSIVSQTSGC